jgi:hypothetical protein
MWNLRSEKSRWRPYIAAGPALVLTNLTDSPIKKSAGPFKLGLQNVGLLLAAYNFGSRAPKFLADSYTRDYFESQDFRPQVFQITTQDKYRQDRVTAGISYTF